MRGRTAWAALCLILAAGLLFYPAAARAWNERHHAELAYRQEETVQKIPRSETEEILRKARAYNALLAGGLSLGREGEEICTDYEKLLDPSGDGIMGTLEIPALDLKMSVHHGTDSATLSRYVGHVAGTSLPVGGESTHAVLSGHSGLAGSRIFSDLEKLRTGDVFVLRMAGQELWYRVDKISVVLPRDVSELKILPGEDLVTLVTCTPYGVNTHRLLVRGVRTEPVPIKSDSEEEGQRIVRTTQDRETVAVLTGVSVIFLMSAYLVRRRDT